MLCDSFVTGKQTSRYEDEDVAATVGENGLKLGAAWAKATGTELNPRVMMGFPTPTVLSALSGGRLAGDDALSWFTNHGNIWRAFHDGGYVTSAFDDSCPYWGPGSFTPYLNHRVQRLNCQTEHPDDPGVGAHPAGLGHVAFRRCVHGEPFTKRHTEWIRGFWEEYPKTPKFAMNMMYGGHADAWEVLASHDAPVAELLEHMRATGALANTVVLMTADHGFHSFVKYNDRIAGEFEHRSPVMKFVLPRALLDACPGVDARATENTGRLVTHRDMHHALLHLASFGRGRRHANANTKMEKRRGPSDRASFVKKRAAKKSYNLFADVVPANRTCRDALIPRKWCNCFVWKGTNSSAALRRGLPIHKIKGSTVKGCFGDKAETIQFFLQIFSLGATAGCLGLGCLVWVVLSCCRRLRRRSASRSGPQATMMMA